MNEKVSLKTANGLIEGTTSINHTGNQKNLIMINFEFENRKYTYLFSRKTGKLYACKLPFSIQLILDENTGYKE